ncbi:formimidoylglutamase [[Flexibacter] sp. ATCC 35208]|uniref:formimidoylglutamase n=1 Tax=[Flexibacter] sp. ATCC 35208 TaxID=1936242 RepID=UPI0009CB2AAC|nr:formimidoylglutamase [[Flexibacter] sp. ATCC 35208]OMP80920.1 formimidoylglutamase [[Flexibacter] sp. ATCC 35208]
MKAYYQQPVAWTGRIDGTDEEVSRWHQQVKCVDLSEPLPPGNGVVLLGFAVDEGVRRNKGRVGAAAGPATLRQAMGSFPVHFDGLLMDGGNIICPDEDLEAAQQALSGAVQLIKRAGHTPILLGGGHEITYGHAHGLYQSLPGEQLGLINFDAHFDLRTEGVSSGTGFWQLSQQHSPFQYLALGIQQLSNTQQLFRIAGELDVQYIEADAFHFQDRTLLKVVVEEFIKKADKLYLTIDLDVFAAAYAPGVSATAFNGIRPDGLFLECFRTILHSGQLAGMDIAELNPSFDVDQRTARLGAALIFEAVTYLLSNK